LVEVRDLFRQLQADPGALDAPTAKPAEHGGSAMRKPGGARSGQSSHRPRRKKGA
jgi:hypothetical protein